MTNKWSKQFNLTYPNCNMCGKCCRCASPSSPTEELKKKAEKGDVFAQDFLKIFVPYKNIEEARKACPDIVERSIIATHKSDSKVKEEELVFYHCKFIAEDNSCTIHKDRPQLCRDYPDMPFLIFAKNCAYESWSEECKKRYNILMEELEYAKKLQKELDNLKAQQKLLAKQKLLNKINNKEFNLPVLIPDKCLISPKNSILKHY